jgi:hypothetical protein
VFDLRGRLVDKLLDSPLSAGSHVRVWRGADRNGAPAASGTYLVRLRSGALEQTRRVSLVR